MSMTRLLAMARKELIQILRDSRSLFIVLLMPVTLMLLFGYGVNLDLKEIPICIYDRDGSQQSQDLAMRFEASEYFHVVAVAHDYEAIRRALDEGSVKMALVLPQSFAAQLHTGAPVSVQALVDATDDNTANILMGYTQGVVQSYQSKLQVEWLNRRGQRAQVASIRVAMRTWYNEDLESRAFIVPGVLALVMSVIGAFLPSLTIAREWERGTMEQLISSPVTAGEIMLGKIAPYFVLGFHDVVICTAVSILWFHTPFRGSYLVLAFASALFLSVVLSMGFLISVVARNQFAASQISLLATFLPAFLLSGFLFSIDQMPAVLRLLTHVVPARYYISILKRIFLKGSPIGYLWADLLSLILFAALLAFLSTRAFHKRLD